MAKVSRCLLRILVGIAVVAAAAQAQPVEQVTKDASGRVIRRAATHPDKSSHRTSYQYRADSAQPLLIVDEDFDPQQRATARVEQRFDEKGRAQDRIETRFDPAGKKVSTHTRYRYDAAGNRSEQVTPVP